MKGNDLTLADVPDIATARLPVVYERAIAAIYELDRIDECRKWANEAEAMASYARQAKDDRFEKMALRIKARATRRCGQLLAKVKPAYGANQNIYPGAGAKVVTRSDVAANAGLSKRQKDTALQVAAVPEQAFNDQVESGDPPTVTELAEQGKKVGKRRRADGGDGTIDETDPGHARETLQYFAHFCELHDASTFAIAMKPPETDMIRREIAVVDSWLDSVSVHLCS